ncbi:MAG TPA: hypothetical protein DCL38_06960 [Lachnospiraceae bacterium]|nr:hypothetical protein [Lachnospiraceae bacterium]
MSKLETEPLNILWHDRRRIIFGLPWTFTKYSFNEERLFIEDGLLRTTEDEVRLYRILDLKLSRTFFQKLFNLGTIKIASSDKSLKNFEIKNIKDPKNVKERLSELIERERDAKRVVSREIMADQDELDDEYE